MSVTGGLFQRDLPLMIVKLTLKGTTHKSKTIKKSVNPRWDETFTWKGVLRDLLAEPLQVLLRPVVLA